MSKMGNLAAVAAATALSFVSNFMNMPPTDYQGIDDGYIRLATIPHVAPGLNRNRFRPIMTFNNPADFVSGPQNQAQIGDPKDGGGKRGGGSFVTFKQPYSGNSGGA